MTGTQDRRCACLVCLSLFDMKSLATFLAVVFFACSTFVAPGVETSQSKPNLLLIVTDDQGYGDVGFQGCRDIPTPNLDRLAREGVHCTSGYVSHPFCSPTRAALMTGRYQQRFGHENNPFYNPDDHREGLPLTEKLLPEFLRAAGYVTGWIGKWHLGAAPEFSPLKRGFTETFGFIGGGHQYQNWKPNPAVEYQVPILRNGEAVEVTNHLTIEFGREAVAFVRRHASEPWFLYLAFNAPHGPQQPTRERLAKFADIADPKRRAYAAQVSLLDDAIGETLEAVRDSGQRERTLVFFFSDNGGPIGTKGNGSVNTPLRGGKGAVYEGGVRVPFVVSWPGRLRRGTQYAEPVSSLDVFATALAAAAVPMPTDRTYDSVNLLDFLDGKRTGGPHRQLFWRMSTGALGMRSAESKLVHLPGQADELYDLATDLGESGDLAGRMPDRVKELRTSLAAWEKELVPPAFPGLMAVRNRPPRKQSSLQQPLRLDLADDWRVEVLAQLPDGVTVSNSLAVPPPTWNVVNAERHDIVPVFNPKAGGWAKGARLQALLAQECTTRYLLDPGSLVLRTGAATDSPPLVAGKDYDADLEWGTFGRLPGGALKEGEPVFTSYRHGLLRLDSVVLTPDRRIELRIGEAKSAAPTPPRLREGERRLANIWLPGMITKLGPENLFPILETNFPEPSTESPSPAEKFIPRALAKLREGKPLRVLAWGDSVTDGSYLPGGKGERWQEQFVARLRERFPQAQIELITEAWGGRNTDSYLAEPPGSEHNYAEKVLAPKPDLVVSEFVNDGWLNEQQVEIHYKKFLDDFTAISAEWIILTPHYVRPDWMGLRQEREIDDDPRPYITGLRQFATRHNVALADASRRYGRLWRQGIPYSTLMLNSINHPNAHGMSLFADSLLVLFPPAEQTVAATWEFNRAGDNEGWLANGHLKDAEVTDGVLKARGLGSDPILEYQPRLEVPAAPWDVVELRLKADRDGEAEIFWSNTTTGRYGGFSQEKSTRFPVRGDGEFHTYRVRPFWHADGKIVRLRFDLYDAASFELDLLRIVKRVGAATPVEASFDFVAGAAGWRGEDGAGVIAQNSLLVITPHDPSSLAIAPPVLFAAAANTNVYVRMAVNNGTYATLLFATAEQPGLQRYSFPIRADGRPHTYNINLSASRAWRGQIIALAIRPTEEAGALALVHALRVSGKPEGEPESAIRSFGIEEFPVRAGANFTLAVRVANEGGSPITNLSASVRLPDGISLVRTILNGVSSLSPGELTTLRWSVTSRKPTSGLADAAIRSANAATVSSLYRLDFTAIPPGTKGNYVPQPKPVRGPHEVGVYYFPGWPTASQWQPIQRFPERRPVLGWYREGDPEVADWHIKWAVEHGITFFIYDWYWVRGQRQLEHGLHDGYFKARYRSLLKFCLLWANHNPPGSSSREDCLNVTRFWIENYFRQPEHVMLHGKPVVFIFAPENLTHDLGGSDTVRAVFDEMRAECVRAGLKGLYLVARVNDAAQARLAVTEGYDAVSSYTWPHLGVPAGEFRAPYATVLEGYRRQWQHIVDTADIPLMPPVCGGWDSRPWHGENNFIRYDRTPELFRQHLLDARQFVETNAGNPRVRNWLILEAWNEWGEGSYVEPHTEYGFGYLDAIRTAMTWANEPHDDLAPVDVGRGPYEVPAFDAQRAAWEFKRDTEGWRALMNVESLRAERGLLVFRTIARDPAIASAPLRLRASEFRQLRVRLRLAAESPSAEPEHGQLYWSTDRFAESGATQASFTIAADGQWHELVLDVASNSRWRGRITRLRFDPCERPGVKVEIDWLRLMP